MRQLVYFVALISLLYANVQVLHKARITDLQEPAKVHPAVRAFTTGTKFIFAVTNSHLKKPATVTVSTPSALFSTATFTVPPLQNSLFNLPPEIQTNYRDQHVGYFQTTNRSITVVADTTVTVVVRNAHSDGVSEDMYTVYPVCSLGTSYRSVGDDAARNNMRSTNIWSVVATQDGTQVTTFPPLTNPATVTINAGQVLTIAVNVIPLTNYQITTNFPVAVISGAVCGFGYWNPLICNYEAIMLFPIQDSGLLFPYTQFISEDRGEVMLFSQTQNTTVYVNGVAQGTLAGAQAYYIFSILGSAMITTSNPSYAVAVSSIRTDGQGSPFLVHIPSVSQFTNQTYIQVTTGLTGRSPASHYIRLQTDLPSTGKLTVDNWVVSPLFYQRQGKSTYYVADFPVQPGTHVIQSTDPNVKYAATVYGHAAFTAYGYTPGIDIPTTGTC
ncbi:unnamed protein product, partial [Mesorhabditis belari]|uniref:IgGFc-binding protein N-terminal domain-containing protein n=1 Tax=Mesorhabditis belari TaxID=2138241 RepID=A0AAF3FM25_9BILA